MPESQSYAFRDYEFSAHISRGRNLKFKEERTYNLTWKVKEAQGFKETHSSVHAPVQESGEAVFETELKLRTKVIYSLDSDRFRPKKANIFVNYADSNRGDFVEGGESVSLAGVVTIDLAAILESNDEQPRYYQLTRGPMEEAQLEIAVIFTQVPNPILDELDLPIESIKRISTDNKTDKFIKKTPRSSFDLSEESLAEIRNWTELKAGILASPDFKSAGEYERVTTHESAGQTLGQTAGQLRAEVEELRVQLIRSQGETSYERQRNDTLIEQLESLKDLSGKNPESGNEEKADIHCMEQLLETQTSKIQILERELEAMCALKERVDGLNEQLKAAREDKQKQIDKAELLNIVERLGEEHDNLRNKILLEQYESHNLKEEMKVSLLSYHSLKEENKVLLETLERTTGQLEATHKQYGETRAEYEAYRLNKERRREIKEKAKIEKLETQQQMLGQEVMRLNEELANFREVEIKNREVEVRNRELKRQIDDLMHDMDDLKTEKSKSKAEGVQAEEDANYVKELNVIIDDLKLEQGKLNQQLVAYKKENSQLHLHIPSLTTLNQLLEILQTRFNDRSVQELEEVIRSRSHELQPLSSLNPCFTLRAQQLSSLLVKLKFETVKRLPLDSKAAFVSSLHTLQQKMEELLV